MSLSLELALQRVRDDGDWTKFYRETVTDWQRMARYLLKRTPAATSIAEEDVAQELLLWVGRYLPKWDGERGAELSRFVVWNAMTRTKRWIRQQSRGIEMVPVSAVPRDSGGEEPELVQEPEQDGIMQTVAAVRHAMRLLDEPDRLCLWAVVRSGGDLALAARTVYGDPHLALSLGVGSEQDARRATRRALAKAAKAMEVTT